MNWKSVAFFILLPFYWLGFALGFFFNYEGLMAFFLFYIIIVSFALFIAFVKNMWIFFTGK